MLTRRSKEERKAFQDALEMIVGWIKVNSNKELADLKWLLESSMLLNKKIDDKLDNSS